MRRAGAVSLSDLEKAAANLPLPLGALVFLRHRSGTLSVRGSKEIPFCCNVVVQLMLAKVHKILFVFILRRSTIRKVVYLFNLRQVVLHYFQYLGLECRNSGCVMLQAVRNYGERFY